MMAVPALRLTSEQQGREIEVKACFRCSQENTNGAGRGGGLCWQRQVRPKRLSISPPRAEGTWRYPDAVQMAPRPEGFLTVLWDTEKVMEFGLWTQMVPCLSLRKCPPS